MPRSGRRTNPAERRAERSAARLCSRGGQPRGGARVGVRRRLRSHRGACRVKNMPDKSDVGTIRAHANQRTETGAPTCVPEVNNLKPPYDAITALPDANARNGSAPAARPCGAERRSEAETDAMSPPTADCLPVPRPASELTRGVGAAYVEGQETDQTTSSARKARPERNAQANKKTQPKIARAETTESADTLLVVCVRLQVDSDIGRGRPLRASRNKEIAKDMPRYQVQRRGRPCRTGDTQSIDRYQFRRQTPQPRRACPAVQPTRPHRIARGRPTEPPRPPETWRPSPWRERSVPRKPGRNE